MRARRVRLPVVAHAVQSKRHAEHRHGRAAADDERRKRLEPPRVEPEPRAGRDDADEDAAARVCEQHRQHAAEDEQCTVEATLGRTPEAEHDGEVAEQRERVPESNRRAKPREPPVVRIERRDPLREERVGDHAPDQHRERSSSSARRTRQDRRNEEAEDEKREVRNPAIEIVPRVVGQHRPDDGRALPHDERSETRDAPHRRASKSRTHDEPREARGHEHRRREHGGAADPGEPRRRVRTAEEERPHEERTSDDERCRGNRREPAVAQRKRRHRARRYHRLQTSYSAMIRNSPHMGRLPRTESFFSACRMNPSPRPQRSRSLAVAVASLVVVLASGLVLAAGTAAPASASTPCSQQVINDWFDDGTVDQTYPRHCYTEAIQHLPRDIHTYSNAADDIRAAMLAAFKKGGSTPAAIGADTRQHAERVIRKQRLDLVRRTEGGRAEAGRDRARDRMARPLGCRRRTAPASDPRRRRVPAPRRGRREPRQPAPPRAPAAASSPGLETRPPGALSIRRRQ